MKKMIQACAFLIGFVASAGAIASTAVCSFNLKPGITDVALDYRQVADVCLPSGEKIADISTGPTDGWLIDANKATGRVMVRMTGSTASGDIDTNLIIWSASDTRYEVKLMRTRAAEADASGGAHRTPRSVTFNVRTPASPHFVPTNVWDDQSFTYIELPKGVQDELPVLFSLADDGSVQLVNSQWDEAKSRFVVQGIRKHFKLMLGEQWVIVDRV